MHPLSSSKNSSSTGIKTFCQNFIVMSSVCPRSAQKRARGDDCGASVQSRRVDGLIRRNPCCGGIAVPVRICPARFSLNVIERQAGKVDIRAFFIIPHLKHSLQAQVRCPYNKLLVNDCNRKKLCCRFAQESQRSLLTRYSVQ